MMDSKGKSTSSMAKVVGKTSHPAPRPGMSDGKNIKQTHSHQPKPTDRRMASAPSRMPGDEGKGAR